ncbi:MAG: response regulator [Myxococcales bacterium]|nr:response regulator [Myxococcales bacterium]
MSDLELLQRRLERERSARKQAEALIEAKSRELFFVNEELRRLNENLEELVAERTAQLGERSAQLEESLSQISAILESISDGLLATDNDGLVVRTNRALERLFNVDEGALGRPVAPVLGAAFGDLFAAADEGELLRGGRVELELPLPGARIGKVTLRAILSLGPEPAAIGRLLLIRDITREKEIDQMKTDFISNVSHELRTPLTSVLGFAKIIRKRLTESVLPALPAADQRAQRAARQAADNVSIIVQEGERLTSLINDVLDIAKMEAGKIEWKREPLAIGEVIERAFTATRALFDQSGLEAVLEIEPGLPTVEADRDRLLQVLLNLISNAVKFSERGAVTGRTRLDPERGEIVVSIVDTGVGIAPDEVGAVFDKFRQVGETLTDKPKGTGLGLSICRQIVEHHRGRIWVESTLGEGSTFSFTLPLRDPRRLRTRTVDLPQLLARLESAAPLGGARSERPLVLVADDEPHIRGLLRQELEAAGYRVVEAEDGLSAIQRVKESHPDLVVLDVMMPKISGFDVAAVIKNDPVTMETPIVILSIVDDPVRGDNIGVDTYLAKPIQIDALLAEIRRLLERGASRRRVMIIDDERPTLEQLHRLLETRGHSVVAVWDAREGIARAKALKPDLIIVDQLVSDQHRLIQALEFEKELEHVLFLLVAEGSEGG